MFTFVIVLPIESFPKVFLYNLKSDANTVLRNVYRCKFTAV